MDRTRMMQLAMTGAAAVGLSLVTLGLVRPSSPAALEVRLTEPTATVAVPVDGQHKVYVAGAVQRPGVYPMQPGDRVADALEAAGGPSEDANLLAINLAKRLRDEEAVIVPRMGEPTPVAVSSSSPVSGAGVIPAGPINLNSAPAAALETLPGIGSARAARIVDSRVKDGPFRDTADLVSRKLVPQSVFDDFKDQVTVN